MDQEPKANTVTFTSADGKTMAFPLDFLIERGAVIANKVNGEALEESVGGSNQLWIPGVAAKYFIRDIVKIDFSLEDEPPAPPSHDPKGVQFTNRPNVAAHLAEKAPLPDGTYPVGEPIVVEGYASDYDKRITAVEFSRDGGEHWTRYDTEGATAERVVYWSFEVMPETAGEHAYIVRAVNEDGQVSPVPATVLFDVR